MKSFNNFNEPPRDMKIEFVCRKQKLIMILYYGERMYENCPYDVITLSLVGLSKGEQS